MIADQSNGGSSVAAVDPVTPEPIDFSRLHAHASGKVALLFSGGKDSRALIELFRPHLGAIIVYHNDTGDLWPETREYVAEVAETVPHFRRIETNAPAWIAKYGVPSPLQPVHRTPLIEMFGGNGRVPGWDTGWMGQKWRQAQRAERDQSAAGR